jgi:hypothetical protein
MTDSAACARDNANAEIDNLICCLEFLAREAKTAGLPSIHAIIKRTIGEITGRRGPPAGGNAPPYTDILQAFRLIARFCLIEDPRLKKKIVRMLESIDKKALSIYAH